ncbi:MAG: hypothetical protein DGJ47_000128 [Rickettsiaceae bacterium]
MLLYILSSLLGITSLLSIWLLIERAKVKAQSDGLAKSVEESVSELQDLRSQNLDFIRKIEQLSEKNSYQESLLSESKKLQQESNDQTKAALFDLGNKLSSQLIDLHKKENNETRKVSEKNIENTAVKFNREFERISNMVSTLNKDISESKDTVDIIKNSLLSPSGAGALAEITLENILKSSGLRSNIDFHLQYNVSDEHEGNILRPDAVIFLPDDRLMVVDSKASKFLVDQNSNPQQLAKTMNIHLRSLSGKNYADSVKKHLKDRRKKVSSIITLMFVPSEHAVEKIMEADPDFLNKAWNANIFPIGPAGLMNMLSFAKFQISQQKMNENNLQIIEEVKKLISSISTMTDHSMKLGNSISSVVNNYDKFAASFNRNFLSKAKKLSAMGVDNSIKKDQEALKRFQIFTSKSELIEVESDDVKELEVEV